MKKAALKAAFFSDLCSLIGQLFALFADFTLHFLLSLRAVYELICKPRKWRGILHD